MELPECPKPTGPADQKVIDDIKEYGWHVVLIPEQDGTPGWAFTIGLTRSFGHPEFVVFGLRSKVAHWLLNEIGKRIRSGHRFQVGENVQGLLESATCTLRPVATTWFRWFFGYAQWFYGGAKFDVLQVIWPDWSGRFPWDDGFDAAPLLPQPLLGEEDRHLAKCDALLKSMEKGKKGTA
jgi:uncharacterized protein DUF4262